MQVAELMTFYMKCYLKNMHFSSVHQFLICAIKHLRKLLEEAEGILVDYKLEAPPTGRWRLPYSAQQLKLIAS